MKLKLIDVKSEANDTKSFVFEPEKEISWLPGQYFYFTLPSLSYPDPKGATRHFPIYLSPTEGKNIGFTTRLRSTSGYKQSANMLKPGSIIEGEGPEGTFILDEHEKGNHVLLAGGIGITPFRCYLKYNIDKKLTNSNLHLIYANSTPQEIAFRKDLESWPKTNNNITVDMTVTKPDKSWKGLTGRIDEKMISILLDSWKLDVRNTTFWVCGPSPMVDAMEKILGSINIPSGKVRSEKFTGY